MKGFGAYFEITRPHLHTLYPIQRLDHLDLCVCVLWHWHCCNAICVLSKKPPPSKYESHRFYCMSLVNQKNSFLAKLLLFRLNQDLFRWYDFDINIIIFDILLVIVSTVTKTSRKQNKTILQVKQPIYWLLCSALCIIVSEPTESSVIPQTRMNHNCLSLRRLAFRGSFIVVNF